jgi:penicillin-binding protein 1B
MPRKPARNKPTTGKPRKKPAAARSPTRSHRKRRYLGIAALLLLAAFAVYLGYLNHIINSRFDGGAWALPSRVYARALEIYPGQALTREQLIYELELSSYPRVASEPLPGEHRLLGESLEFNSRAFDFADHRQDSRRVQVFFDGGKVSAVNDSRNGNDLSIFRLPPFMLGSYYPDNGEDRLLLAEDQVPQALVDALIAVEDRAFFEHSGVSPLAIMQS